MKKPFVPFASGRTVSRRQEGDENIVETELDKPDRFAIVMAGSYQFEEETRDGMTVRVASYAAKNDIAIGSSPISHSVSSDSTSRSWARFRSAS